MEGASSRFTAPLSHVVISGDSVITSSLNVDRCKIQSHLVKRRFKVRLTFSFSVIVLLLLNGNIVHVLMPVRLTKLESDRLHRYHSWYGFRRTVLLTWATTWNRRSVTESVSLPSGNFRFCIIIPLIIGSTPPEVELHYLR